MATFKITYVSDKKADEEVDATRFNDEADGEWITFWKSGAKGASQQILRVRSGDVERIERVG